MIIDLKRHAVYRAVFYPVERLETHMSVTRTQCATKKERGGDDALSPLGKKRRQQPSPNAYKGEAVRVANI